MGLRDILMLVLGYGCIPIALYNAYYGLLAYFWLSFMKPQSLVWSDEVQATRFILLVGIAMVFRAVITAGPKLRLNAPTVAFLAFWAWMGVTTWASTHVDYSMVFLVKFSKIGLAVLLLTGLVRTRQQLKWMVLLLAVCPGFYAVKLGVWRLLGYPVTHHGGPMGMDNNDTALFIAMGIPMLVFAATEVRNRWGRLALYSAAVLAVPAVVVSESRGGMLAMAAAVVLTALRRMRLRWAVVVLALAVPLTLAVVPPDTLARYKSILNYRQDSAAMGRLDAWDTAGRMLRARPMTGIGIGADTFLAEYDKYKAKREDWPHVAHSIWFTALAGMGYPGLALFVLLLLTTFLTTRKVRGMGNSVLHPGGSWARNYAGMIECATLAFLVGGTFISQIGFEFAYAVLLLSVPLSWIAGQEAAEPAAAPAPARRAPQAGPAPAPQPAS